MEHDEKWRPNAFVITLQVIAALIVGLIMLCVLCGLILAITGHATH